MKSSDPEEVVLASDSFEPIVINPKPRWDDDVPDPEASTYPLAERGPEPVPAWVISQTAARQHDLGILKTGKEAEVIIVERTLGDRVNRLAAKRYRELTRRSFRNDARYRAPRSTGDRRIDRAMASGTRKGLGFRANVWAQAEFDALSRLWTAGVPVPYPVQLLGTEVMLELIGDDSTAAPRLADVRPRDHDLDDLAGQAVDALKAMTECGVVHGDLSPYNVLVWEGRLILIDFPQAGDAMSADGVALLRRDVSNLLGWMAKRGAAVDVEDVCASLVEPLFH